MCDFDKRFDPETFKEIMTYSSATLLSDETFDKPRKYAIFYPDGSVWVYSTGLEHHIALGADEIKKLCETYSGQLVQRTAQEAADL